MYANLYRLDLSPRHYFFYAFGKLPKTNPNIRVCPVQVRWFLDGALNKKRHKALQSHTPNKWVFNDGLNCPRLSHWHRWAGSLFHGLDQLSQTIGRRKCCTTIWQCTSLCQSTWVGMCQRRKQADSHLPDMSMPNRPGTGKINWSTSLIWLSHLVDLVLLFATVPDPTICWEFFSSNDIYV